mgnify:CR=1 FL=1
MWLVKSVSGLNLSSYRELPLDFFVCFTRKDPQATERGENPTGKLNGVGMVASVSEHLHVSRIHHSLSALG